MFSIFESRDRRSKDALEVESLFRKYGEETVSILRARAKDRSLSDRDRKHWKRIFSKAKSYRFDANDEYSDRQTA